MKVSIKELYRNTKKFADTAQYIVISMGDEQFGIDIKYIDKKRCCS